VNNSVTNISRLGTFKDFSTYMTVYRDQFWSHICVWPFTVASFRAVHVFIALSIGPSERCFVFWTDAVNTPIAGCLWVRLTAVCFCVQCVGGQFKSRKYVRSLKVSGFRSVFCVFTYSERFRIVFVYAWPLTVASSKAVQYLCVASYGGQF
jgi:hypothetical protein